MTPEQAAALRKPFPPSAIGKLPKPYKKDSPKSQCKECKGYHGMPAVHLDYVGHAAASDRLLQVDPDWSWEPFALDTNGLPLLDQNRNLWIRLTVAGVTRIGVGDGMSLKECIGDAIRNAAMRFGVALDLWAKEDLHAMDTERGTEPEQPVKEKPAPVATRTMSRKRVDPAAPKVAPEDPSPLDLIDPVGNQMKALHASLNEAGLGERVAGLAFIAEVLDRPVASTKDLTVADASKVLNELKNLIENPFPPEPPMEEGS